MINKDIKNTERCKIHLEELLNKNGFQLNSLDYPNLISVGNVNIKVVCPDTKNPKYLAVNANKKTADFYVGYVNDGNTLRLVGFAKCDKFRYFPEEPNCKWIDPTYRIHIEQLQDIQMFFEVLRSLLIGSYV